MVVLINNSKELLGEFRSIQTLNGRKKPLVIVMHCNTRSGAQAI